MDNVNQPPHYNTGDIECIQAIQASMTTRQFQGYLKATLLNIFGVTNIKIKKKTCKKPSGI